MPVTFVTSFYDIYNGDLNAQKTIEWRVERFNEIAGTGINICVYTCSEFAKYIDTVKYPNLYLAGTAVPRTPPAPVELEDANDSVFSPNPTGAGGMRGAASEAGVALTTSSSDSSLPLKPHPV